MSAEVPASRPIRLASHCRGFGALRAFTPRVIVALAIASLLCAVAADAQETRKIPRIGFLAASHASGDQVVQAFMRGLRERGYVEGRDFVLERRSAEGRVELLPALADELVKLNVDVIVAPPVSSALAAQKATRRIPVVFALVSDPVGSGLVSSLSRPGANITGLSTRSDDLIAKMVEMLSEAVPGAIRIAVLLNPAEPLTETLWKRSEVAARALKVRLERFDVRTNEDLERAIGAIAKRRPDALVVLSDPIFLSHRERIVREVADMRLPAIYSFGNFTEAGGLISYGVDLNETFARAAGYVDRILRGAKPSDLPVEQPARFELVVNLKAAASIGLTLPRAFELRADRVIE
jgi:putative tryptophan/tyrosine transport system substrate-binding protein